MVAAPKVCFAKGGFGPCKRGKHMSRKIGLLRQCWHSRVLWGSCIVAIICSTEHLASWGTDFKLHISMDNTVTTSSRQTHWQIIHRGTVSHLFRECGLPGIDVVLAAVPYQTGKVWLSVTILSCDFRLLRAGSTLCASMLYCQNLPPPADWHL